MTNKIEVKLRLPEETKTKLQKIAEKQKKKCKQSIRGDNRKLHRKRRKHKIKLHNYTT